MRNAFFSTPRAQEAIHAIEEAIKGKNYKLVTQLLKKDYADLDFEHITVHQQDNFLWLYVSEYYHRMGFEEENKKNFAVIKALLESGRFNLQVKPDHKQRNLHRARSGIQEFIAEFEKQIQDQRTTIRPEVLPQIDKEREQLHLELKKHLSPQPQKQCCSVM